MNDQLVATGLEALSQTGGNSIFSDSASTAARRAETSKSNVAVCALSGLIIFLFLLVLPSISLAAPPSSGSAKNLSNTLSDGSPAPGAASTAAIPAQPVTAAAVPLSSGFDYPVGGAGAHEGYEMNNCFSCDWEYYIGHTGEDFDNGRGGDPVYAASEGVVTFVGLGPGAWGNVIIIQHNIRGGTLYTQYAHLSAMYVTAGQVVGRRQQIGLVGMTGTVAPHLHFEVKDRSMIGHGYTGYPFSGLIVAYDGITFFAPSWYINDRRIFDTPFGSLEGTSVALGGVKVGGWVIDPNTADPIDIQVTVDGVLAKTTRADLNRPDVGAAYPAYGPAHGYSAALTVAAGTHQVCVNAVNTGAGADNMLGCREVVIDGNPLGSLEGLSVEGGTQLRATGWAIDPDTVSPIDVQFYLNGVVAGTATAADVRSDVGIRYPEYGSSHGFSTTLPLLAGENQVCAYGVNTGAGSNTSLGCRTVTVPLDSLPSVTPPSGRHYYWTYFDSAGSLAWMLFANPAGASGKSFDLNIKGRGMNLGLFGGPSVAGGNSMAVSYRGIAGGSVVATSLSGEKAIVSQRSLWKGGNSLEEVLGTDAERLSSHFYWTWYDNRTPGWFDWVLVSNPGSGTIYYRIRIAGAEPTAGQTLEGAATGSIAPGQSGSARFNIRSGPVEVLTYSDPEMTIPADSHASQRVLSNMGTPGEAFNEVPGIPENELSADYLWTWYDNVSPGAFDWVLIANPQPDNIYYRILVKGSVPAKMIEGAATGMIAPGQNVTPRIANVSDGPLEVQTFSDPAMLNPVESIASQRVLWGPSFEEVPGTPRTSLASDYHWTWYDQFDSGTYDWVHIVNTNPVQVYYSITVAGTAPSPVIEGAASGVIAPNDRVHPRFAKRGGPVEVKSCSVPFDGSGNCSSPATVMTSQRVLWHGYFNEVLGTVLD
ncbi:MAG: M23 family metallopeptidase [Thermoleophilia bacterium]